jgi:hypothetical protein
MRTLRLLVVALILSGFATAASTYKVTLTSTAKVGATELKPGDYKVTLDGDKAVFASGKTVMAEVPVTVENGEKKYGDTRVSMANESVQAIAFGGTKTKVTLKK